MVCSGASEPAAGDRSKHPAPPRHPDEIPPHQEAVERDPSVMRTSGNTAMLVFHSHSTGRHPLGNPFPANQARARGLRRADQGRSALRATSPTGSPPRPAANGRGVVGRAEQRAEKQGRLPGDRHKHRLCPTDADNCEGVQEGASSGPFPLRSSSSGVNSRCRLTTARCRVFGSRESNSGHHSARSQRAPVAGSNPMNRISTRTAYQLRRARPKPSPHPNPPRA